MSNCRLYTKMLRIHLFSIFTIKTPQALKREDTDKYTLAITCIEGSYIWTIPHAHVKVSSLHTLPTCLQQTLSAFVHYKGRQSSYRKSESLRLSTILWFCLRSYCLSYESSEPARTEALVSIRYFFIKGQLCKFVWVISLLGRCFHYFSKRKLPCLLFDVDMCILIGKVLKHFYML